MGAVGLWGCGAVEEVRGVPTIACCPHDCVLEGLDNAANCRVHSCGGGGSRRSNGGGVDGTRRRGGGELGIELPRSLLGRRRLLKQLACGP